MTIRYQSKINNPKISSKFVGLFHVRDGISYVQMLNN